MEIKLDDLNLSEPEKQLVRKLSMWLNSTEASPQGEGYPDRQAFTSSPHIWQAYRVVYMLTPNQEQR